MLNEVLTAIRKLFLEAHESDSSAAYKLARVSNNLQKEISKVEERSQKHVSIVEVHDWANQFTERVLAVAQRHLSAQEFAAFRARLVTEEAPPESHADVKILELEIETTTGLFDAAVEEKNVNEVCRLANLLISMYRSLEHEQLRVGDLVTQEALADVSKRLIGRMMNAKGVMSPETWTTIIDELTQEDADAR